MTGDHQCQCRSSHRRAQLPKATLLPALRLPFCCLPSAIDWLSVRDCPTLDTPPRQCKLVRDGFYPLAALAVACGAGILLWLQRVLPQLEALPLTAWHARAPGRGARSGKRQ